MRGIWLQEGPKAKDGNLTKFNEVLKSMVHLRRLIMPYVANTEIFKTSLSNCPNLTYLDVSGASEIEDKEVDRL